MVSYSSVGRPSARRSWGLGREPRSGGKGQRPLGSLSSAKGCPPLPILGMGESPCGVRGQGPWLARLGVHLSRGDGGKTPMESAPGGGWSEREAPHGGRVRLCRRARGALNPAGSIQGNRRVSLVGRSGNRAGFGCPVRGAFLRWKVPGKRAEVSLVRLLGGLPYAGEVGGLV